MKGDRQEVAIRPPNLAFNWHAKARANFNRIKAKAFGELLQCSWLGFRRYTVPL